MKIKNINKLNIISSHFIIMSFLSLANASSLFHDENSSSNTTRQNSAHKTSNAPTENAEKIGAFDMDAILGKRKRESADSECENAHPQEAASHKAQCIYPSTDKGKERIFENEKELVIQRDGETETAHTPMFLPPEVMMMVLDHLDSISLERSKIGALSRTMAALVATQRKQRANFIRKNHAPLHYRRVNNMPDEELYKYHVLRTKNFTQEDPESIRALIDKYPFLKNRSNFDRLFNAIIFNNLLDQVPESERPHFVDLLAALGINQAEHFLVGDYQLGVNGAPVDLARAYELNQRLVEKGDREAVKRRENWLQNWIDKKSPFHYMQGLPSFTHEAHDGLSLEVRENINRVGALLGDASHNSSSLEQALLAVDTFVSAGNFDAYDNHLAMFKRISIEAATRLNNIYIKHRYLPAIEYYFSGRYYSKLFKPIHFYENKRAPKVAKELGENESLLEVLVEEGHPYAIERAFHGFARGRNGLPKSKAIARTFLDLCVQKSFSKAVTLKFDDLTGSGCAYHEDVEAATELNDWAVSKGCSSAIKRKLESFLIGADYDGRIVYEESVDDARDFVVERALAPNPSLKDISNILVLASDNNFTQEEDMSPVVETLNILHQRGNVPAIYLKALGLKFGLFGFPKDSEAANQLAMTYLVG